MMSRSPDYFFRKKIILSELCPFPTLAFCMDNHIVGGIKLYKDFLVSLLFLFKAIVFWPFLGVSVNINNINFKATGEPESNWVTG